MEENRKEYAFILTVGKKVVKPVAVGWWCSEKDKTSTKCGMSAASRAFKKTAGILVYEREKDMGLWAYCDCCDVDSRLLTPAKLDIEGGNITKKYYRDYSKDGVSYMEGDF